MESFRARRYFNPRFPRGKRRDEVALMPESFVFQSTPPAGEATHGPLGPQVAKPISIHASREGSDLQPAV